MTQDRTASPPAAVWLRERARAATRHLDELVAALEVLGSQTRLPTGWGVTLAARLSTGSRLLVAGNGGSAAQAQHLTAELVGRYRDERRPLSAIALHADTSSYTAISNDYGADQVFARQVDAHGRRGDVLLALSTSGASANVLAAVRSARRIGMTTWAMTGRSPNPLSASVDEALCVSATEVATIQETHLVAVHLMCEVLEVALCEPPTGDVDPGSRTRDDASSRPRRPS